MGGALLLLLAALRLPWLAADPGNSTFWAYAYFSYDEAAYTSGGRHAYLTGAFLDPALNEPHTFSSAWGMHFLGYLGYRLAGLNQVAIRWPVATLTVGAWLAMYAHLSRRTVPWLAGLIVALISSNPGSLTYERTCSTDATVGALAVLAWLSVTRRSEWLAGVLLAFACTIKANAVVLIPLVLFSAPPRRLPALLAMFALTVAGMWAARGWCVSAVGGDPAWVLAESSRWQYALGSLSYRPLNWLNPLSVFPRWLNSFLLGPFVVWALALPPLWVALYRWRTGRWWSRRHAVPVGMLLYIGALAVQPNNSLRHYLPLLFFVPVLLVESRWLFRARGTRPAWWPVALATVALAGLYWFQFDRGATPAKVAVIAYNDVTVPHNAWLISGARLLAGWLIMSAALWPRYRLAGVAVAWVTTVLFFANYTISLLNIDATFVMSQVLLQLSIVATLAGLFAYRDGRTAWLAHAAVFAAFCAGNHYWSQAYAELAAPTYHNVAASRQLAEHLPADAVVIGRRASTLLRDQPVRLGMCINYDAAEFVAKVAALLARQPVYWLVDGDEDWMWDVARAPLRERYRLVPVASVAIPSGDILRPRETADRFPFVPIHLIRIEP